MLSPFPPVHLPSKVANGLNLKKIIWEMFLTGIGKDNAVKHMVQMKYSLKLDPRTPNGRSR